MVALLRLYRKLSKHTYTHSKRTQREREREREGSLGECFVIYLEML